MKPTRKAESDETNACDRRDGLCEPVYCGIFTFRRVRRLCAESEQSGAVCGRKADPGGPACAGGRPAPVCVRLSDAEKAELYSVLFR